MICRTNSFIMHISGLVARLMPKMWFRMLSLRFTLRALQPKEGNPASTGEEAAKMWWNALSENDWVTAYKLDPSFEHSSNLEEMKLEYGGLQINSIGSSFKSGRYAGVYVPYEVKLKSGEIQKHNLAVRNDNPQKA